MPDYFAPGDYNVICDRTGFKLKRSQCRLEWTGSMVRNESWEARHPQDLIRSIPDDQSVPYPNPEASDDFLTANEAIDDYGASTPSSVTATATPGGGNTGDGSLSGLTADLSADTSGNYTVTFTSVTVAAASTIDPGQPAQFDVRSPTGAFVGSGKVDTVFTGGGLSFTAKEDGSTAFAVGDTFTISVS